MYIYICTYIYICISLSLSLSLTLSLSLSLVPSLSLSISYIYIYREAFTLWLIHLSDMTHSHLTRLIRMWITTRLRVWQSSFMRVMWDESCRVLWDESRSQAFFLIAICHCADAFVLQAPKKYADLYCRLGKVVSWPDPTVTPLPRLKISLGVWGVFGGCGVRACRVSCALSYPWSALPPHDAARHIYLDMPQWLPHLLHTCPASAHTSLVVGTYLSCNMLSCNMQLVLSTRCHKGKLLNVPPCRTTLVAKCPMHALVALVWCRLGCWGTCLSACK